MCRNDAFPLFVYICIVEHSIFSASSFLSLKIMKKTLFLIFSFLSCLNTAAQTTPQEIIDCVEKAGGNYYPYPTPSGKATPAPEGFEPFYISHYGRHGARFMSEDEDIKRVVAFLKGKTLTEIGKNTLAKLERFEDVMRGKKGELTPLGYQQLTEIATRMYANYPSVFEGEKKVEARSTYVPRSIISMSTSCLTLKGLNNQLDIRTMVRNADMHVLNKDRVKSTNRPATEGQWYDEYLKFCRTKRTNGKRLISTLTTGDTTEGEQEEFCHALFNVACAVQDMPDLDFTLFNLFTADEIWGYWQAQNAFWYGFCGVYGTPNIRAKEFGEELWEDIVERADAAIAGNKCCLDLRYGHDTGLLPFLVMMNINNVMSKVKKLDEFHTTFADFKVIPMAANIQFVFYRNSANKIIVKVLVNEEEATLPIKAQSGPYYDWEEVKKISF